MSQFSEFLKEFKTFYKTSSEFIWDDKKDKIDLVLVKEDDNIKHDSYGSEDSELCRIYHSQKFNIFVKFYGTRQSYSGEEWREEPIEVKPTEKIETVYEDIR